MPWPALDPSIAINTDELNALWDRFEIFEALHHTMTIDNPMTSADLDEVVALLAPADGESMLDLACGHGELLRRIRRSASIDAHGVDLSPWMIRTAHQLAEAAGLKIGWTIGDAKHHGEGRSHDLVTSLGATWIWHGSRGTVRAVAERLAPGGRMAIGDMHLRDERTTEEVVEHYGAIDSVGIIESYYAEAGIELIGRVATTDEAWDDYLARTRASASAWAQMYPGERADRYLAEQQDWERFHERDRDVLTWSVFVGRKRD